MHGSRGFALPLFLAAAALLAAIPVYAGTDVSGDQSGTWSPAGSPYYLTGDVTVPAGQTLVIMPGVEVAATDTFRFTVHGTLLAEGTADAPILFHAATPGGRWRGLRLENADPACRLAWCTISDGEVVGSDWPEDTGGGLRLWHTPARVEHCTFSGNTASYFGAGAFCYGDSAVFDDCLFTGNHSYFDGGGLYLHTSNAAVLNSRFLDNTCDYYGAGLAMSNSYSTIHRCVFVGNSAGSQGGAVRTEWSGPVFSHCTVTDNSAAYGGGFYVVTTTVEMVNCIDRGNSGYYPDLYLDWLGEVHASHCDIHGDVSGPGVFDLDPLFVDPAAGDYRLADGSPCIDAGTTLYVVDGDTLLYVPEEEYDGAAPDVGALEHWIYTAAGDAPAAPARLLAARPNPFNPATSIPFELAQAGPVRLEILDLQGRRVRRLLAASLPAGHHAAAWDGRDAAGRRVPSGTYVACLRAGGRVLTRSVMLVK